MTDKQKSLYYAALAADDAFQAALVKQFGARAGDMRYRPHKHNAETKTAAETMRQAVEATRTQTEQL